MANIRTVDVSKELTLLLVNRDYLKLLCRKVHLTLFATLSAMLVEVLFFVKNIM